MSFLAVTAIGFFMPHFNRKIPDSIAMMVSANIGLLPYQAYQFNSVSVVSFLANIPGSIPHRYTDAPGHGGFSWIWQALK